MRTELHYIAGLGWIFTSLGMKNLVKHVESHVSETDGQFHYHQGWDELLDGIVRRWREKGPAQIMIVGHSWGCWMAQRIALALYRLGIPVEYIACIDATALPMGADPMVIPDNVKFVREFWATSGFPAGARRRDPKGGDGGMYVIFDKKKTRHSIHVIRRGHIMLPRDKMVKDLIVNDIKRVVRGEA